MYDPQLTTTDFPHFPALLLDECLARFGGDEKFARRAELSEQIADHYKMRTPWRGPLEEYADLVAMATDIHIVDGWLRPIFIAGYTKEEWLLENRVKAFYKRCNVSFFNEGLPLWLENHLEAKAGWFWYDAITVEGEPYVRNDVLERAEAEEGELDARIRRFKRQQIGERDWEATKR